MGSGIFRLGGGLKDVYDYVRSVDIVHKSFFIALLQDDTCLIFYMDIASMLFVDVKVMSPPNHLVKGKESSSACAWKS